MHKAIASTAYYGMLHTGELTKGDHPVNIRDVYLAENERKTLIILQTSKTHKLADNPQQVKLLGADVV